VETVEFIKKEPFLAYLQELISVEKIFYMLNIFFFFRKF